MKLCNNKRNISIRSFEDIIKDVYENMEFYGQWSKVGANNFIDTKYINCVFKRVHFNEIIFSNVIFESCTFEDCQFLKCEVGCQGFLHIFRSKLAKISMEQCRLPNFHIKECYLLKVNFKDNSMTGCNLINNNYIEVKFIDNCNLIDAIIKDNDKFMDIRFINEKSYSKVNYGTYIGKFNYKVMNLYEKETLKIDEGQRRLDISNSYMDFGDQFLKNHVEGKYGVCFYESKVAFHGTLKGKRKFISGAYDIVCGYGERPGRTFWLSLILIIGFSFLYMNTGIKTFNNELINLNIVKNNMSFVSLGRLFIYSLYFSIVTFATVGYGDIMVVNISGMIVSIIEIIAGVFMIGVWTSTLVRKITR